MNMSANTLEKRLNTKEATFNMVEQQIRPWDVLDTQVLDLFHAVPRDRFVAPAQIGLAYADIELPIGHGETMLSPKMEGKILQAVAIKKTDRVLIIGTGSGYLTALAAKLADHVHTVEAHSDLLELAKKRIQQQNIHNVSYEVAVADAFNGFVAIRPFDVIIFTGALELRPTQAEAMLTVGGRLFAVIGQLPIMQATLTQRITEDAFRHEAIFETNLPPLKNAPQAEKFIF
jgi:protein-L-isoaspartate(D-aspartate) O-methyltransferase